MKNERAFPVPNNANVNNQEGMTLRDYFAAKAMQGIISSFGFKKAGLESINDIVEESFLFADAMLKAREEK